MVLLTQTGDSYESFILEGKELTKKIFDLDIEIGKDCQNETEAGHYEFMTDIGYLHCKFCEMFIGKYRNADLKRLIEHTVCHEIGHAFDARCFAKSGIFPFVTKISDQSIVNMISFRVKMNHFLKKGIGDLINSIFDYSIDKKIMNELELSDQTATIRMERIRMYLNDPPKDDEENRRRIAELLFNLPTYIHDCRFGDTIGSDKDLTKQCCMKYLDERKWDSTSDLLNVLSVGDPMRFKAVAPVLLKNLFGLRAFWKTEKREDICNSIPIFWDKEAYDLLYIG